MESLLVRVKRLQCYDSSTFTEIVATGTGFSGPSRANLRSLCSKTGIKYCGDLMSGWTTHLIVSENTFNAESASTKMQVAAKWGVPIVRLQWLLDSIQQGEPLCEDPYLVNICISPGRTPAAKAVLKPAGTRPVPSSKQGSNLRPSRTPLKSVENVTGQLEKLIVTPKASSGISKQAAAAAVEMQAANKEQPAASPAAAANLLINQNSAGETPSASFTKTEIPSEMAVVIEEFSSPTLRPATEHYEETEEEDGDEEVEVVLEDDGEEEDKGAFAAVSEEPMASNNYIRASQQHQSPQWWNTDDELWVPGSQPQDIVEQLQPTPAPEWSSGNPSFSFGIVPKVSGTSSPPPLPLPLLIPEIESTHNGPSPSSTPMSDLTPLDIKIPDVRRTRITDSPYSSCSGSETAINSENEENDSERGNNEAQIVCATAAVDTAEKGCGVIIEQGGQPQWWEDDCSSADDIDDNAAFGYTIICEETQQQQQEEQEKGPLEVARSGTDTDDGEEPSPVSVAFSNHGENITHNGPDLEEEIESQPPPPPEEEELEDGIIEDSEIEEDFSENQVIARARAPLPPLPPLPSGLPQPADDAVALKVVHRAPRGSTVKARYRLANTKQVTFAEEVHLRGRQLTLNVKDKQKAILLAPEDVDSSSSSEEEDTDQGPILAEPISFYRCLGEDMQMEYYRLYTGYQALAIAKKAGVRLRLPPGFDSSVELLKGTTREHADMRRVQGTVPVRKTKLGVAPLRTRRAEGGNPLHYWRCEFDAYVPEVLMP